MKIQLSADRRITRGARSVKKANSNHTLDTFQKEMQNRVFLHYFNSEFIPIFLDFLV